MTPTISAYVGHRHVHTEKCNHEHDGYYTVFGLVVVLLVAVLLSRK